MLMSYGISFRALESFEVSLSIIELTLKDILQHLLDALL